MEQLTVIPLNEGQQAAAEGFFEFLFGKQKEAIISGPGGVGKTYTMGYLIDMVMPNYMETCRLMDLSAQYTEVVMTATTNKAAEVLAEATGRAAQTIHSLLNLTVREDYSTGEMRLTRSKSWKPLHNMIIFIDECSMIDRPLRQEILATTVNCKIIYVGDHVQLAPIKEPISPIYRDNLPFWELTQQMRTSIVPLQQLNAQLRQTVETGVFKPIQIVPGIIDWLDGDQMQEAIDQHFKVQTLDNRILAYTNKRVVDYNEYIRELRGLPTEFTVGEQLISNTAIQHRTGMIKVEEELQITAMSDQSQMEEICPGTELEVRFATLENRIGDTYRDVMLPVDRAHYSSLVKYFQSKKNWPTYFFLRQNFPDLRQRDAATVHKAQGSTYNTVFVDLEDISTCRNPDVAARLLYVAFSRARTRVVLYGELAEKFGGLIH